MFNSSGYFKHLDCPFLLSGLCERHYCHFRHSNCVKVETFQIPRAENELNVGFLYNDNYLSSINDNEYNPVNFVNDVKPSYSPASNSSNLVSLTKSQSIQTETDLTNIKLPIKRNFNYSAVSEKASNKINVKTEKSISKIPVVQKSISKSKSSSDKKMHKEKEFKKKDKSGEDIKKAQRLEALYHSIFEESSDDDEEKSVKPIKKVKKCDKNEFASQPKAKSEIKVEKNSEIIEMEEALKTGRYKGCRLTTSQILRFRMIIADYNKQSNN